MSDHRSTDDLELLGLPQGAGPEAVREAYRDLKQLYAPDSLATYTLLDDQERSDILERVEAAYRRLIAESTPQGAPLCDASSPEEDVAKTLDGEIAPGNLIRRSRERSGMSLREIAERTKLGVRRLEHIEEEQAELLPAPVFLRGYVAQFAAAVGLDDPDGVAQAYLERLRRRP